MESLRVPRDFKSGSSLLLLLQSNLVHRVTALVEFQAQIRGIRGILCPRIGNPCSYYVLGFRPVIHVIFKASFGNNASLHTELEASLSGSLH